MLMHLFVCPDDLACILMLSSRLHIFHARWVPQWLVSLPPSLSWLGKSGNEQGGGQRHRASKVNVLT